MARNGIVLIVGDEWMDGIHSGEKGEIKLSEVGGLIVCEG